MLLEQVEPKKVEYMLGMAGILDTYFTNILNNVSPDKAKEIAHKELKDKRYDGVTNQFDKGICTVVNRLHKVFATIRQDGYAIPFESVYEKRPEKLGLSIVDTVETPISQGYLCEGYIKGNIAGLILSVANSSDSLSRKRSLADMKSRIDSVQYNSLYRLQSFCFIGADGHKADITGPQTVINNIIYNADLSNGFGICSEGPNDVPFFPLYLFAGIPLDSHKDIMGLVSHGKATEDGSTRIAHSFAGSLIQSIDQIKDPSILRKLSYILAMSRTSQKAEENLHNLNDYLRERSIQSSAHSSKIDTVSQPFWMQRLGTFLGSLRPGSDSR